MLSDMTLEHGSRLQWTWRRDRRRQHPYRSSSRWPWTLGGSESFRCNDFRLSSNSINSYPSSCNCKFIYNSSNFSRIVYIELGLAKICRK